jgi:RimJ/RimL family protein N-acetyltransferase
MTVEDVILDGEFVRLEPMRIDHLDALAEAGLAEGVWRWTINDMTTTDEMREYIETALDERRRESSLPFVTRDKASDKIVGSTRFGNIDVKNRKTEIGWTWIHPDRQRTYVNTEAKLLMLTHAFETWNCIRVELKTDALNERSRNAILRIGAKFEGIFRQHMITDSGRLRDTAYFSIIDSEWPAVRAGLQSKLGRYNK